MRRKPNRPPIYDTFRDACARRGTNLSTVLNDCNRSSGNTGAWKTGSYPKLDIAMDMCERLNMSLDELCYGAHNTDTVILTDNQREWLRIIECIPEDKQQMCKDFLKTHAVVPEKYEEQGKRIS